MSATPDTLFDGPLPSSRLRRVGISSFFTLPPKWFHLYAEFITKNSHQVSQIESALRSLTHIIPGRFRDAEIASESIHSGVQLLSLYHDILLRRAVVLSRALSRISSPHNRYTSHWTGNSSLYRRIAYLLQIVSYTELLCEMGAKRRGKTTRWCVVWLLEAMKAACRLMLLRITCKRSIVTPALPERDIVPEEAAENDQQDESGAWKDKEKSIPQAGSGHSYTNGLAHGGGLEGTKKEWSKDWTMPRTGTCLPSLPASGDISVYLLSRVLTADDIKPATRLLNSLRGPALAAEVLHILSPLIYVSALACWHFRDGNATGRKKLSAWTPWLLGFTAELAARQLRHSNSQGLRMTPLERDEWSRRGWAMGWWTMREPFYENVTKDLVAGLKNRVPGLVAGILEDYEYLWQNYYFSTSA